MSVFAARYWGRRRARIAFGSSLSDVDDGPHLNPVPEQIRSTSDLPAFVPTVEVQIFSGADAKIYTCKRTECEADEKIWLYPRTSPGRSWDSPVRPRIKFEL